MRFSPGSRAHFPGLVGEPARRSTIAMNSPQPQQNPQDHPLILYDGVCGLCNRSVQFVIKRDPQAHFRFAPLQSDLAKQLLANDPASAANGDLASVILIESGKIYHRSTAALRIAAHLNAAWPLLSALRLIPRPLRDAAYNFIAQHRYQWFGKQETCQLPTPAQQNRFLE